MPDFVANQPAMLARLPLHGGLDRLDPRYGSAKNTLDNAPWHHRLGARGGSPCPASACLVSKAPCHHDLTSEKHTLPA